MMMLRLRSCLLLFGLLLMAISCCSAFTVSKSPKCDACMSKVGAAIASYKKSNPGAASGNPKKRDYDNAGPAWKVMCRAVKPYKDDLKKCYTDMFSHMTVKEHKYQAEYTLLVSGPLGICGMWGLCVVSK